MKVFLAVPVYNGEKYLAESLDSIIGQSFENWTCYISNNHSTDGSQKIIETYLSKDSRFRCLKPERFLPAYENINFIFSNITEDFEYAKVVCADDWLYPTYLDEFINVGEKDSEIGLLSSFRLDDKKVDCAGLDFYRGNVFKGKQIIEYLLTGGSDLLGSMHTVTYRVKMLKLIDSEYQVFNTNNLHADSELGYELLNLSKFGFVYKVLSYTRRHDETGTSKARRYGTYYFSIDALYEKYSCISPSISKYRKIFRDEYSFHLLRYMLSLDFEAIEWHNSRLKRKIGLFSMTKAVANKMYRKLNSSGLFKKRTFKEAGW